MKTILITSHFLAFIKEHVDFVYFCPEVFSAHHLFPGYGVALAGDGGVHQVHHPSLLLVTQRRRPGREVRRGGHHRNLEASTSVSCTVHRWVTSQLLTVRAPLLAVPPALSPVRRRAIARWPLRRSLARHWPSRRRCRHCSSPASEAAYSEAAPRTEAGTGSPTVNIHQLVPTSFPNLIFNQGRWRPGGEVGRCTTPPPSAPPHRVTNTSSSPLPFFLTASFSPPSQSTGKTPPPPCPLDTHILICHGLPPGPVLYSGTPVLQ